MSMLDKEIAGSKFVSKLIQLEDNDKKYLEKKAKQLGITSNQLIRIIIKNYIKGEK